MVTRNCRFFPFLLLCFMVLSLHAFITPSAAAGQNLQVGTKAPDFTLKDLNGQAKTFADVKGAKLTVLVFWASWSKNSPDALTKMEDLYHKYKGKGLAVVAINVDSQDMDDQTISGIKARISELKLDVPVLIDYGLVAFHDYEVIAVPTVVVLDHGMKIKYELFGFPIVGSEELLDYINGQFGAAKKGAVSSGKSYKPDDEALRCYNLGMRMLKGRMASMAPAWFEKAIAADPKFARPNISLGEYYQTNDEPKLAREQFEQALSKEPDNVIAMCDLGKLLADSGNIKVGMPFMEKALKLDEAYTPCYYLLGYYSGKGGDMPKAHRMFDAAAKLNPMDPQVYMYEGKLFEEKGDVPQAAAAYGKALKIILRQ